MTKLGNSSTQPECRHRSNDADTEMGPERLRNVLEMSQLRQGGGRSKPKWSQSNASAPGHAFHQVLSVALHRGHSLIPQGWRDCLKS